MPQPRLLLIDDEPALADYLAKAAQACGFEPIVTGGAPFRASVTLTRLDPASPVSVSVFAVDPAGNVSRPAQLRNI